MFLDCRNGRRSSTPSRAPTTQRREGCFGAQPVGVAASGQQELCGRVGSDAVGSTQAWVGGGVELVELGAESLVLASQFVGALREGLEHEQDRSLDRLAGTCIRASTTRRLSLDRSRFSRITVGVVISWAWICLPLDGGGLQPGGQTDIDEALARLLLGHVRPACERCPDHRPVPMMVNPAGRQSDPEARRSGRFPSSMSDPARRVGSSRSSRCLGGGCDE